jgi:hypothetical protein
MATRLTDVQVVIGQFKIQPKQDGSLSITTLNSASRMEVTAKSNSLMVKSAQE